MGGGAMKQPSGKSEQSAACERHGFPLANNMRCPWCEQERRAEVYRISREIKQAGNEWVCGDWSIRNDPRQLDMFAPVTFHTLAAKAAR